MIDGYHKWLGIPKDQRPATYYQLLGIAPGEQDIEVIEAAAVRQVAFVRNFQAGPHAEQCSRILTELAEARLTLLNPAKRARYDSSLATAKHSSGPPPQDAANPSGDDLSGLSSLLTERETTEVRLVNRGRREGWSSLTIAVQCAITGFTLVAAYYLLEGRWKKPSAPAARARNSSSPTSETPLTSTVPTTNKALVPATNGRSDVGPSAAVWEIIVEPADANLLALGTDVRAIGSAPGRRVFVIDAPEQKRQRSLKISAKAFKPLSFELVTSPGGRTRTHVELEGLESTQDSTRWDSDAKNLVPFPAPPLTLEPPLAASGAEEATPSPAELEIRSSPPQTRIELQGLKGESEAAQDDIRRFRLPGADGSRTLRVNVSLDGYKAVEKTLTPLPGERRTLSFRLERVGSTGESTASVGRAASLPPAPAPTWAVFLVHLDPVPRSLSWTASGLKARSYRTERGVHLYQITAPDGTTPIKFHYSAAGFKPLETTLTPRPGERQELIFHFAASGSNDESRIILTPEAKPPAPAASPGLQPEVKNVDGELRRFEGSLTRINAVAITPDGKRALSAGADGQIRVYDPESGRLVRHFHAHKDAVLALAIAPTGHQVLSAGVDPVVRLWEIATGHSAAPGYSGCTAPVVCVAFTPKGDHICAGDALGFRVWNIIGPAPARRFTLTSETAVVALAATPHNDGAYVARSDRIIECDIAGATQGRQVGPILNDARPTALDVAPGGGLLVLGFSDGTLRLWDGVSGREIRRFEKHGGRVNSALFSSDGKTIVSGGGSDDPTIRLWEVDTGFEIARFKGHSQAVTRVSLTPGDRQLLSGSLDRTVRLWDVPQ